MVSGGYLVCIGEALKIELYDSMIWFQYSSEKDLLLHNNKSLTQTLCKKI